MILYLVTAPALSLKKRRYCTPRHYPWQFFFQTKDLIGESVFLGYLLTIFFL